MGKSKEGAGEWSRWQRASRYEIRAAGRIVPVVPLEEYDPWEGFRARLGSTPPYQALLDLAAGMRLMPGKEWRLAPETIEAILDWSARWGALGLEPRGSNPEKGESVEDFVAVAGEFYQALDLIEQGDREEGAELLNKHLAGVAPALVIDEDGKLKQAWAGPTLLGSFALMALADIDHPKKKLFRCPRCQRLTAGAHALARYCDLTCRNAVQKRNFRRKRPDYEHVVRSRRRAKDEAAAEEMKGFETSELPASGRRRRRTAAG